MIKNEMEKKIKSLNLISFLMLKKMKFNVKLRKKIIPLAKVVSLIF